MLLNRRPLNSTPLNTVGTQALVVTPNPALSVASIGEGSVVYSTVTAISDPAISTALTFDPVVGVGYRQPVTPSIGEGVLGAITPHIGLSITQADYVQGEGRGDSSVTPRIGISLQPTTIVSGEGSSPVGRIIFGLIARITPSYSIGLSSPNVIPRIGILLPPLTDTYGEGVLAQIGTTLDDVVVRGTVFSSASVTQDTITSSLILRPSPAISSSSVTSPSVQYSSVAISGQVGTYALAYPFYGAPVLSSITINTLSVNSDASVDAHVIITSTPEDGVTIPQLQVYSNSSVRGSAINGSIAYRADPALSSTQVEDPDVTLSDAVLNLSVQSTVEVSGICVLTDATFESLSAESISTVPDAVVRFSTATLQESVTSHAQVSEPEITLGSITPPAFAVKALSTASAVCTSAILSSITISKQAIAVVQVPAPVIRCSSITVTGSVSTTAIVNNPSVSFEDVDNLVVTPPAAISTATVTGTAISEALTIDLMGRNPVSTCGVSSPSVTFSSVTLTPMPAESAAVLRFNIGTLEKEVYREYKAPLYYHVLRTGGDGLAMTGSTLAPNVGDIQVVDRITEELLTLHRAGTIKLISLLDISQRTGFALIDLTTAVTDGAIDGVVDFDSINKAVAELAQQQNDLIRDISALTTSLEAIRDAMAHLTTGSSKSIGNLFSAKNLGDVSGVTALIRDRG